MSFSTAMLVRDPGLVDPHFLSYLRLKQLLIVLARACPVRSSKTRIVIQIDYTIQMMQDH